MAEVSKPTVSCRISTHYDTTNKSDELQENIKRMEYEKKAFTPEDAQYSWESIDKDHRRYSSTVTSDRYDFDGDGISDLVTITSSARVTVEQDEYDSISSYHLSKKGHLLEIRVIKGTGSLANDKPTYSGSLFETEVTLQADVAGLIDSNSIGFADFDDDGALDLFIGLRSFNAIHPESTQNQSLRSAVMFYGYVNP